MRAVFARSLVLGLFHSTSAVRINSTLRARRDLLGVPLPTGLVAENAEQRFGVLSYDLFSSGGALRLGDWATVTTEGASGAASVGAGKRNKGVTAKLPSTSNFTHADVRKIASIGLGELEASIRASAVGQLLDMLGSDAHLLHTADADWCAATLRGALQQLSSLAPIASNAVTCDADRMQAMTDAECRLFTETSRLVCFFFTHFAFLRNLACFHATATARSPSQQPVAVLLRVLLGAHQLKKTNTSAYDAVQQAAATSAQVLCLLAANTESWALPTERTPVAQQYVSADGVDVNATSLCVPVHVARRFCFPSSVRSDNEYSKAAGAAGSNKAATVTVGSAGSARGSVLGHIVLVSLHCAPETPAMYPTDDIVRLLVAETGVHSADRSATRKHLLFSLLYLY